MRGWFAVDGERVDVPQWHWYPHRWAGGAFTTDYDRLRDLLPSPPLYPVRVRRRRALVCASGAYVPAAGHAPPFLGFGEVALMAFVTVGEKAAPPLIPGMGRWAMRHFGFGFFPLMMVVTNRVAAGLYRSLLGIAASVADLRVEQRTDRERFVCEGEGRLLWDLTVRSDGRPSVGKPGAEDWYYTVEGGEVYRIPVGGSGISRSRFGGMAASVVVGDHPAVAPVRRLGLSRSWAGEFTPDRHLWLTGAPEKLGAAAKETEPCLVREATCARLVVSPNPGVELEVDQGLAGLGWDADAALTAPGLHERADGSSQVS